MQTHIRRSSSRQIFGTIFISIFGNTLLFVLKYWVGIRSNSLALLADAWHTISDTLSSLIVLLGVYIARRPPDSKHPFGHGRYELLTTLVVGGMLAWVAVTFLYRGIEQLLQRESANFGTAALVVTVIGIVLKELMARITFWVARRTHNTALYADGWHHRSDALSSVVVLCGIFVGYWFWWIDGVLSIIVALMIAYVAWQTIRRATSTLLGEAPTGELKEAIQEIITRYIPQYELLPHDLQLHNYIQNQELILHIVLPDEMTVQEATTIIATLEQALAHELQLNATLHIESRTLYNAESAETAQLAQEEAVE